MKALNVGIIVVTLFFTACKTVKLHTVCKIPAQLQETSGLIASAPNSFWTFNDSGGEPKLYEFDSKGTIQRFIYIKNATNIDWEEIAIDHKNNTLYIGDFGNNSQTRRNLVIYKIKNIPSGNIANLRDTVTAERIEFAYEDQLSFPPPDSLKVFDAEAMLVENDSIFIFTKDFYSNPYKGITRIYTIPTVAGKHIAKLSGIFKTNDSWKYRGAITAAAKSRDGKMALMSYQRLWVWQHQNNLNQFWLNPAKELNFGLFQFSQKEGISFDKNDDCIIYITSEKVKVLGGHLTRFNICKKLAERHNNQTFLQLQQSPTPPSVGSVILENSEAFDSDGYLKVFNIQGQDIASIDYFNNENKIFIENGLFPTGGMYFYTLFKKDNLPIGRGKILIIK